MVELKIVIGQKDGKSVQKQLSEEQSEVLMNKKIGDKISGSLIDFEGYEFEITGGSDNTGFPMRKDVEGILRKKILTVKGVGVKKKAKGIKQRKRVAGNTVYEGTAQINLKILKAGSKPLIEAPAPEQPAEEAPAKESKPEKVKEETKKEKSEEAPIEKKENAEESKSKEQ